MSRLNIPRFKRRRAWGARRQDQGDRRR